MEYDPVLYKLNLKLLTKTLCKLLECDQSRGTYTFFNPAYIRLPDPGSLRQLLLCHLLIDTLGVLALAHHMGFDQDKVEEALNSYVGPKRRYIIEEYKDTIFVDDYAHHPTEVKVTIEASRKRYPNRKIIAIFKPHRASRVLYFAKQFKEALEEADEIYLLDFTSIDDKQDGTDIDITYLANMIPGSIILPENDEGAKMLAKYKGECLVFMSSKDIYNIAERVKELI